MMSPEKTIMTNVNALTKLLTSSMTWDCNSACFLGLSGEGVSKDMAERFWDDALSTLVSSMAVTSRVFIYMPAWDELIPSCSSPLTTMDPLTSFSQMKRQQVRW